jgi:transcription-repair coupling factor (superfamily II helicase)
VPTLSELIPLLSQAGPPPSLSGIKPSATALLAAQTSARLRRPLLLVTASESQAGQLAQDLALFTDAPVHYYPGYEIPPYSPLSPDPQTTAQRLAVLYRIKTASVPYLMVASCEALLRKVLPAERLTGLAELIISGEEVDQEALSLRLIEAGYEAMSLVQNAGEFSRRGGIMDIFPPGFDTPIRLDFFGDTVESMRLFDPISQRSIQEISEAEIIPVSDVLFPSDDQGRAQLAERVTRVAEALAWSRDEQEVIMEKVSRGLKFPGIEFFLPLFHDQLSDPMACLPAGSMVFLLDPHQINRTVELVWERIVSNFAEARAVQSAVVPAAEIFLTAEAFNQRLTERRAIKFFDFEEVHTGALDALASGAEEVPEPSAPPPRASEATTIHCGNHTLIKQHLELQRQKSGLLAPLTAYLKEWLAKGDQVHIACRSERHANQLGQMLEGHELAITIVSGPALDLKASPAIRLYPLPLSAGFDLPDERLHFLSEVELFGEKRLSRAKKRKAKEGGEPGVSFEELKLGDIVVHRDHGLAIYDGINTIKVDEVANDFLLLTYKEGDKIYVPVDRINTISKYNGLTDKAPVLSRLGSKAWSVTKKKVQEAVWKVAQHLLTLYAQRQVVTGTAFTRPDALFHELEESFPFDETPGQAKAITEVLDDLTSERCMDRLVCGDVGFGKTEVAIRAAFKAAADGYQVAVLVPTTVLAEQHAATFRERLQGFPVTVECLNRFRTTSEQKDIVKRLAAGRIDIIIGTHRILSKDIVFKRLGLLIIDEEHRFGVSHKERLKLLRTGIDVLTLTATPIPRTLQMSLLGVRDLSVINTPPVNRQSVKTFIAKYSDLVIKEAIIRELQRGGQVFLVHNRVHSIHDLAFKVQKLVPEARIAVAHGQMAGKILEEIMVSFVRKEVNVLICTTIIESGLDIPNANTIIINRADRMGLAEIYQLRGRVGRSKEQAFAYLLVPSLDLLSKDAKQRLRALMDYNELGGGFKLALSDLQIRGGGNILGESQSGTIAAVGYDLYLDLLQRTVEDLKRHGEYGEEGPPTETEIDPEINLRVSASIPAEYIPDLDQRYIAYRRIASIASDEDAHDLMAEFTDRYGELPPAAINLFSVITLKLELKQQRIVKLEEAPSALVFTFAGGQPASPERVLLYVEHHKKTARITPDGRLVVKIPTASTEPVFETVRKVVRCLG